MGIDEGFDMVPRLSTDQDKQNWRSFIEIIKEHYKNDSRVEIKPNYIEFNAGEHPLLPFEGHKFLRFSAKISGSHAEGVEDYIRTVTQIAKGIFGSRIQHWNDGCDVYGFYNWSEVNDSLDSYDQLHQPDEPETATSITQSALDTNSVSELNSQLFDIQSIPNKGKGLIARVDIAKGTRILCEKPILTMQKISPMNVLESAIATKLRVLSKREQQQFLSLHNNFPGKHPFSGIMKTNALPCGPDSVAGAVYPTICFINHSCLANSHNNWNGDKKHETIHAIKPIKAGEEITIPYDKGGPYDSRRVQLKNSFGFDCTCNLCTLPLAELKASDARRRQIQRLDDEIGDPYRVMTNPGAALADCHSLLQTLEAEYGSGILLARVYYDAFQISITHGDQARASIFAERGYMARIECEGEDSPETQKMKTLMENPAGHRNFGASKKWKTTKRLIPKGVGTDEFEKWLWREGR